MGRILKIVLVGLAAGMAAGVVSLAVEFGLLAARMHMLIGDAGEGSGGLGAVSAPVYAPYVAILGFLVGTVWQFRRSRRRS